MGRASWTLECVWSVDGRYPYWPLPHAAATTFPSASLWPPIKLQYSFAMQIKLVGDTGRALDRKTSRGRLLLFGHHQIPPPPFFFPTSTPGLHLSRSLSFFFFPTLFLLAFCRLVDVTPATTAQPLPLPCPSQNKQTHRLV